MPKKRNQRNQKAKIAILANDRAKSAWLRFVRLIASEWFLTVWWQLRAASQFPALRYHCSIAPADPPSTRLLAVWTQHPPRGSLLIHFSPTFWYTCDPLRVHFWLTFDPLVIHFVVHCWSIFRPEAGRWAPHSGKRSAVRGVPAMPGAASACVTPPYALFCFTTFFRYNQIYWDKTAWRKGFQCDKHTWIQCDQSSQLVTLPLHRAASWRLLRHIFECPVDADCNIEILRILGYI